MKKIVDRTPVETLDRMIEDAYKHKNLELMNAIADMLKYIVDNREEEA